MDSLTINFKLYTLDETRLNLKIPITDIVTNIKKVIHL